MNKKDNILNRHIYFAHGNGFPSPCYQELFDYLQPDYQISYLNMSGHQEDYPVTENWDYLVEELVADIKAQKLPPVVGLGHSLGGILLFRAAIMAPELFSHVIMLDSPILGLVKSQLLHAIKKLGWIDKITPAKLSRARRRHWPNKAAALQYFKSKPLFAHFTEQSLKNYIEYGLVTTNDGVALKFDPNIETAIYRTLPHNLPRYRKKLQVPTTLIYGALSDVVQGIDRLEMRRHFNIAMQEITGSHMFPFEYPQETAALIKTLV